MKFDLRRMAAVMSALGNPHDSYPSVHIAGTNGKGSVAAMIAQGLRGAGYRTALYTSPHLERLNERFQINGIQISDKELSQLIRDVRSAVPKNIAPLTQFEFLTAMAFLWFSRKKIDVAVIETGLGGRLDATNVMNRVALSVITTIDYDHMNWLGNTIPKIAAEKAGILKSGVPVVTAARGPALNVIKRTAHARHAPIYPVKTPVNAPVSLPGKHQKLNAAVALKAMALLKKQFPRLTSGKARSALRKVSWPGRFESFQVASGKNRIRVVLDGAHNAAGAAALAETLSAEKLAPVRLLFAVLKDKEIDKIVRALAPVAHEVAVVPAPSDRTANPAAVARMKPWKGKAKAFSSIVKGWQWIARPDGRGAVVAAGSLYLIGAIRKKFHKRTRS